MFQNLKINVCQFYLVFLCIVFFTTNAKEQQDIILAPAPNWSIQHNLTLPKDLPIDDIRNGIYYQLVDNQIQITASGARASFSRYIDTIVNQTGLKSSSQINLNFDPSYQKIVLHSLFIIRNGQRIDRLQSAKKSLLNTETDLSRQIYSGSLTLNILIADLEVGDSLDYSYTRYGANPVYQDVFSYSRNLNWSIPVHTQHMRILWGKNKPLYVTTRNIAVDIKQNPVNDFIEYKITMEQAKPQPSSSEIPVWYDPYGSVYFSESKNWLDIVDWAKPLYQFEGIHSSIKQIADNIKNQYPSKSEQVVAALQYTQQKIRYVGLEMGKNSHVPTAPEDTLTLKYGDCKDKVALFIAILAALEVEAFPALVNTKTTKLINDLQPASNIFNHVIVNLNIENTNVWLDPTLNHQKGSLTNIYQPDYGYALILRDGENSLTSMHRLAENSYSHLTEKFFIPKGHEKNVTFTVETKHSGEEAMNFLYDLDEDGKSKLSENYKIYYQASHPELFTKSEMEFSVDKTAGTIFVLEPYEIKNYWSKGDKHYEANFYPTDVRDAVFKPKQVKRTAPLAFEFPNNIKQQFEIKFESDGWDFDDEKFTEDNPFFSFNKSISFSANTLLLEFDYHSKVDNIPAAEIDNYLAARKRLIDAAYFGLVKYIKTTDNLSEQGTTWQSLFSWFNIIITIYLAILLFVIVSWRLESKKRPKFADAYFYPMSLSKFIILSVVTFGFYDAYWTYRNWKFIKTSRSLDIMPIARGIFSYIWFYPLFSTLKEDSIKRFGKNKVMLPIVATFFAVTYLVLHISSNVSENIVITVASLLASLLLVPFVLYINLINKKEGAYQYNSKWQLRHIAGLVICIPLVLYTFALETPLLPSDSVRTEDQMLKSDLKYLYRKQVLPANETIQLFYSDAIISIKDDGNGFTEKRVFSYWLDEVEGFKSEVATFKQIKNIEVEYAEDSNSNSIISITRKDSSNFIVIVSAVDEGDKAFYRQLNKLWKNQK